MQAIFQNSYIAWRALNWAAVVCLSLVLVSCTSLGGTQMRQPVPEEFIHAAFIAAPDSTKRIRYWGDDPVAVEDTDAAAIARSPKIDFLSLSGGGYNGAYGAGFLMGWTAHGDRPQFEIVTGISVGALLAPFAFLGPEYDQRLLDAFNGLATRRVNGAGVLGVMFGAGGTESNVAIKEAIAEIITDDTVAAIGREHTKGRRLLIGTTNLDAERPVVWNIGEIALSTIPEKTELIRKVMLASAALPGIYDPVLIEVEANGETYSELHVDGGVTQQIVLVPENVNVRKFDRAGVRPDRTLYIIYNGEFAPNYTPVEANALGVLTRTVPTFIKYLGRGDIARLRATALRNGAKYRLTAIPEDFKVQNDVIPDAEYLAKLIRTGYEMGQTGFWRD